MPCETASLPFCFRYDRCKNESFLKNTKISFSIKHFLVFIFVLQCTLRPPLSNQRKVRNNVCVYTWPRIVS